MNLKKSNKLKTSNKLIVEYALWSCISILYQLEGIIASVRYSSSLNNFFINYISEFSFKLVIGFIILLFPIIFKTIFGFYPLILLKTLLSERLATSISTEGSPKVNKVIPKYETNDPIEILKSLCQESETIAKNIYTRSNLYLLVGTLIAISGILFFSFQSSTYSVENFNYTEEDIKRFEELVNSIHLSAGNEKAEQTNLESLIEKQFFDILGRKHTANYTNYLLAFIPRFGALFFIEFIAFFFLKQYRNSMDEYKYYESVKRNRQEVLFKINFFQSNSELKKITDIKEVMSFILNPDILESSQTSELIEKRKLSKDEIGIMEKIVDTIVKLKK